MLFPAAFWVVTQELRGSVINLSACLFLRMSVYSFFALWFLKVPNIMRSISYERICPGPIKKLTVCVDSEKFRLALSRQ